MLDELREQALELSAVRARQRREERLLRGLDSTVEAFQGARAGGRDVDEHAPAVVRVTHARDEPVSFELTEEGVHVTAVDQQASPERRLTRRSPLGEGAQHDEMLPTQALGRERVGDKAGGGF